MADVVGPAHCQLPYNLEGRQPAKHPSQPQITNWLRSSLNRTQSSSRSSFDQSLRFYRRILDYYRRDSKRDYDGVIFNLQDILYIGTDMAEDLIKFGPPILKTCDI